MPYTDQNNLVWTRSEDLTSITCEDGRQVLGNAEMTDEYLVSVAYHSVELEAQLAALLAKLS